MYDEERPYEAIANPSGESERQGYWDMGSGLQAVDGLEVSQYAQGEAARYVAGKVDAYGLARNIEDHYEGSQDRDQREADVVAARITAILDGASFARFELTGRELCIIHGSLFKGILPDAWTGTYRVEDISKREPVLGGSSVAYAPAIEIAAAVDYDMSHERAAAPYDVHGKDGIGHFTSFVAGLWQTHPFREGNTRTTAVFSQLYLRQLGVDARNEPFRANSLYYRDALVRASVTAPGESAPDFSYLRAFYDSVINGITFDPVTDMNIHGVRDDDTEYRDPKEYQSDK